PSLFFFSSRRRHTRFSRDWSSDVCSSDLAAGGVGSLLSQWARHLGARVIGTVGSEPKVDLAQRYGCSHVIQYRQEDFVARVNDRSEERRVGKECRSRWQSCE